MHSNLQQRALTHTHIANNTTKRNPNAKGKQKTEKKREDLNKRSLSLVFEKRSRQQDVVRLFYKNKNHKNIFIKNSTKSGTLDTFEKDLCKIELLKKIC